MIYLDNCFVKNGAMVSRLIAGEMILVPIRDNIGDLGSIYILNEIGSFIWQLIDSSRTGSGIKEAMVQEYDVPPEEAEQDLIEFLTSLEAVGAIKQVTRRRSENVFRESIELPQSSSI